MALERWESRGTDSDYQRRRPSAKGALRRDAATRRCALVGCGRPGGSGLRVGSRALGTLMLARRNDEAYVHPALPYPAGQFLPHRKCRRVMDAAVTPDG